MVRLSPLCNVERKDDQKLSSFKNTFFSRHIWKYWNILEILKNTERYWKCWKIQKNTEILKIVKNPFLPLCDVERKDHHQFSSSSRHNSCAISIFPQEQIHKYLFKYDPSILYLLLTMSFFKMPSCAGKNKRKGVHVEEFLSAQQKSKNKSKDRGMVEVLTPHWRDHWGKRFPAPMLAIASRWTFSFIALIVLFLRFDEKKTLFARTSHSW